MDEKNQGKKPGNPWTKSLLIWVAVLFGLVLFVRAFDSGSATQGEKAAESESIRDGSLPVLTKPSIFTNESSTHR